MKKTIPPYLYNKQEFTPGKSTVCYAGPNWDDREIYAAIDALLYGKWLTAGTNVKKFEKEFSKFVRQDYSVMVNSGSSANLVMIGALKKHYGWSDSSEIVVSPVGFPTTIAPIVQNNLKPRFVDITMKDLNFDLNKIEKEINHNTVAIFISPVLGNPPDIDRLVTISKKMGIHLIFDCCDSLGTTWNGKALATYGVASSYSFYPAHHISTGEGGMVSTNNKELANVIRSMANWGRACFCSGNGNLSKGGACGNRFRDWLNLGYDVDHKFVFDTMGYNIKPLDLQGAIGLEQLKKIVGMNYKRRGFKWILQSNLEKYIPELYIPLEKPDSWVPWFGVPIICPDGDSKQQLQQHFENNKIQTRNYFAGNILLHPAYSHLHDADKYPVANGVLRKVFFLGCSPTFTTEMIEYIVTVIEEFSYNE